MIISNIVWVLFGYCTFKTPLLRHSSEASPLEKGRRTKMKKENYNKGKIGETIAREYLESKGFNIIDQNYSNDLGEIDLIVTQGNFIVFVEVKMKIGDKYGIPEEMITKGKLWQIRRVAEIWLLNNEKLKRKFPQQRIDAICMIFDEDLKMISLKHYDNVE
jgi:putative endonuclease